MFDLVVRGGTVVTDGAERAADVGIRDGRIAALGEGLAGGRELDARGMLVLPGGIDPHVHLAYPQGPARVVSADDWETGTIAAACGGTTTVIDFVEARADETWMAALAARRAEAEAMAAIDFGLHMTFHRTDPSSLAEVPEVIAAGVPSFKFYMAYDGLRLDDGDLLVGFEALAAHGGLALVHAENHDVIRHLVAHHRRAGHTHAAFHPLCHPATGEAEATERALALCAIAGNPVHIVHVSAVAGLAALARARDGGQPATGEVCPQHLVLTDAVYAGADADLFAMAPPLRRDSDREALWAALRDGGLDFVVTDHCPFTRAQRRGRRRTPEFRRTPAGVQPSAAEEPWSATPPSFDRLPGGGAGIETRMALVHHHGVAAGRLSPSRFVEVTSTAAARRFGLYPRKGTLAPGADADVVLFDREREVTISAERLHQNVDHTPFEGLTVRGWPRTVLSRGELLVHDFEWVGSAGRGRFLARGPVAGLA